MMTTEPIIESELTFGPFPEGHCFRIEKSQTYKLIEDGVKTVEFLLLRPNSKAHKTAIWMIEAKKSSLDPKSHGNLDKRIEKMCEKLIVFVLVINNCEEEWLPPIQEALNKALRPTIKTWNLLNVLVLNKDMARRKQLVDLASIQI